jgi:hypothetical protein
MNKFSITKLMIGWTIKVPQIGILHKIPPYGICQRIINTHENIYSYVYILVENNDSMTINEINKVFENKQLINNGKEFVKEMRRNEDRVEDPVVMSVLFT